MAKRAPQKSPSFVREEPDENIVNVSMNSSKFGSDMNLSLDTLVRVPLSKPRILETKRGSFQQISPMAEKEGYFLCSFELSSSLLQSAVKIGFTRAPVSEAIDLFDNIDLCEGTATVSGRSYRLQSFPSLRAGDLMTLAITRGPGQMQLTLKRTGECIQAVFPSELPVMGPLDCVVEWSQLHAICPLNFLDENNLFPPPLGFLKREEESLMLDGPIPLSGGLHLEISSIEEHALLGFTTALGAAFWVGRSEVGPLWLIDFEASEITFVPGPRGGETITETWRGCQIKKGDKLHAKIVGRSVRLAVNGNEVLALDIDKGGEQGIFLLMEGLHLRILNNRK